MMEMGVFCYKMWDWRWGSPIWGLCGWFMVVLTPKMAFLTDFDIENVENVVFVPF
jgi:hypothetical protein